MKVFLFLLLLFGSCSSEKKGWEPPPVAVEVGLVDKRSVPVYMNAIGNVFGYLSIDVRPQVTGQILEANVKEGDWVKEGQLLFTLDPSVYKAAFDKAQATLAKDEALLELSKIKLERNLELVKKEFISKVTYDELKSNVEAQEAQVLVDKADVKSASINLERTKIYAFSSGKISRFNFDPGNIVNPSDTNPLTTIQYIDQVYINFSIPEKYFDKIHPLDLLFDVFIDKEKQVGAGKVVFVDNKINAQTGTFLLRGLADNSKKLMWPGQFVRVRMLIEEIKEALLVPEAALQPSQKGALVWVVSEEGIAKSLSVQTGEKESGWVVVKGELKKGDKVVTLGQQNLRDGAKVFIP